MRTSDVVAFRLTAHHLAVRQPADKVHEVVGACGIQNSPPGSALLALHARVEGVTPDLIDRLVDERSLLQTWTMRGAPFFFPTTDAPIFTAGVLPATETGRLHLIVGVEQALNTLGIGLDETVALVSTEITAVLSDRQLAINELGVELAARIAPKLSAAQRKAWEAPGPYGTNQPLGEAVVHFCLRILTLQGIVCLAPRSENKAPFVLTDEWLGKPLPAVDPTSARADLLRRYMHCYGPSTRKDFAAWVGVLVGDVDAWWTLIEDELTRVEIDGSQSWILSDYLEALHSPPISHGVRFLPPRDPYTQMRDREAIVDKKHHREVWKAIGEPGTVLADGTIAGTWRPKKVGRKLTLTVNLFQPLRKDLRESLHEEAQLVGGLRGASTVITDFSVGNP